MLRIGIDAEGPVGPSATWTLALRRARAPLVAGGAVVVLGSFHGGFAPTAWGWSALAALWLTVLTLVFAERVAVGRAALVFAALVVAFVAWTAASAAWSLSVSRTMLEVERDLVYVGCVACVLVLPRATVRRALAGLVVGLVVLAAAALGAYLVTAPVFDSTQGYLLFRPLGYANALGVLAALAAPPALAAVEHAYPRLRAVAAAATVVLAVVLYLTQNRSAWLALGVAIIVWLLRTGAPVAAARALILTAVPAAAAVAIVASLGLLDAQAQPQQIATQRHLAGAAVVACAGVAALLAGRVRALRVRPAVVVRGASACALLVAAATVAALSRLGDRAHYWRAAWHGFRAHPLAGGGAGTFDVQWFRYRDVARTVRDAHNLYLGTLAELGVVGLVLLVALLVTPVVCARRTRDPLLTALLGSYCAFLVHVAFEWDWKFPVVTGVGLALGTGLVAPAPTRAPIRLRGAVRAEAVVLAALAAVFAVATLAGNSHVAAAEARMVAGDPAAAATEADRARRYLPWASEPWLVTADAGARAGDAAVARAALRAALARDDSDWTLWVRLAAITHGRERTLALRRAFALNPLLVSQ